MTGLNDGRKRWLIVNLTTGRKALFNTDNIRYIEEGEDNTVWIECGNSICHADGSLDDIIDYLRNGGIL